MGRSPVGEATWNVLSAGNHTPVNGRGGLALSPGPLRGVWRGAGSSQVPSWRPRGCKIFYQSTACAQSPSAPSCVRRGRREASKPGAAALVDPGSQGRLSPAGRGPITQPGEWIGEAAQRQGRALHHLLSGVPGADVFSPQEACTNSHLSASFPSHPLAKSVHPAPFTVNTSKIPCIFLGVRFF